MTVTLGGRDYPSFTTIADADIYLAGDVSRAAAWSLRDPATAKPRGIISATRMLQSLPGLGDPALLVDPPEVLADVCAMLAADLLNKPKLFADASANSNIKQVKAGSASVEFFRPVVDSAPIPLALWRMLVAAGLTGDLASEPGDNSGAEVSGISCNYRPWEGRYADDLIYDDQNGLI